MLDAVRSGQPRTCAENIESVKQAFSRSSMKSIRTVTRELELSLTRVHKILQKRLQLYAYKSKCYRDFSQMTSQNEKSLQITSCNEFLKMKDFLRMKSFSLHPAH